MINNLINTMTNNKGTGQSEAFSPRDSKQNAKQNEGFFTAIFQYFNEGGNEYVRIIGTVDEELADQTLQDVDGNSFTESSSGKNGNTNEFLPNQNEDPKTGASENSEVQYEFHSGKFTDQDSDQTPILKTVQKTFINKVSVSGDNGAIKESSDNSHSDNPAADLNNQMDLTAVSVKETKADFNSEGFGQDKEETAKFSREKSPAGDNEKNSADTEKIRFRSQNIDVTNPKNKEPENPIKLNSSDVLVETGSDDNKSLTSESGNSQQEVLKKSDVIPDNSKDTQLNKSPDLQLSFSEEKKEFLKPDEKELTSVNRESQGKTPISIKNEPSVETAQNENKSVVLKEGEPAVQEDGKSSNDREFVHQNSRIQPERLEVFQALRNTDRSAGFAARVHNVHSPSEGMKVNVSSMGDQDLDEVIRDTNRNAAILDGTKNPEVLTKGAEKVHQTMKVLNKRSRTDIGKFTTRLDSSGEKQDGFRSSGEMPKLSDQQLSKWVSSVNHQSAATADSDEMTNEELLSKEFVSETIENKEKNNPNQPGLNFTRLADITISNISIRKNILPGLSQFVLRTATESQSSESWQKHNFVLEDGSKIQLSARSIEGVMQIRISSSMGDLHRLLQLHQQEILEHLEKECELEIDLQFENQHENEQASFFDDASQSSRKSQGNVSLSKKPLSASTGLNDIPAQIRKFGYNQMEWTA